MPPGRPRAFDRDEGVRRAMDLFWRGGYQDTSVSDLTGALGISAPSLYAAYGSKAGLFTEAADRYQAIEGAEPLAALDAAPTAMLGVEAL
ncbi:TetR family transcriptional regulator, partial [cyanobacterium TDX16]